MKRTHFSSALFALFVWLFSLNAVNAQDSSTPEPDEAFSADSVSYLVEQPPYGSYSFALPPCAQLDSNFLRLPAGCTPPLRRLVSKLDSVLLLGLGRVSIVHIGGSHVQADMYTDVFRRSVDSLNNGLRPPRGYLFPYAAARTNNPLNYRTRYGGKWTSARCALRQFTPSLGVGGIAVSTSDPTAWIDINMDRDSSGRWQASRLHLMGRSQHGHISPVVYVADTIRVVPDAPEPTGWLFSLPQLVSQFTVKFEWDSLAMRAADSFVLTGLVPDNDDDGIVYHTIGVNGASVPSYLGCADFERDMRLLNPDLMIFAIGINDANDPDFSDSVFVNNYSALIRSIRRAAPQCALVFITNNDSYRRVRRRRVVNQNGPVAQHAFYDLARKWGGAVWDLYEVMGGLTSMKAWQDAGLARKDKVHFNREGYAVIGSLFYEAFLDFYLRQDF